MENDLADNLIHRDLNWLSFNARVLQEAQDKENNPLYERMKFLAIYSSNLDEYFRVRVSQLRQMKRVEKSIRKKLALKPNRTVKQILAIVKEQQEAFGKIYNEVILPELAKNNIVLVPSEQYTNIQAQLANIWFIAHIKNNLETKVIDPSKEKEIFLENQSLYLCVTFSDSKNIGFGTFNCGPGNRVASIYIHLESVYGPGNSPGAIKGYHH